MDNKEMIEAIIITAKSVGAEPDANMLFALAFKSHSELKAICAGLKINTDKL